MATRVTRSSPADRQQSKHSATSRVARLLRGGRARFVPRAELRGELASDLPLPSRSEPRGSRATVVNLTLCKVNQRRDNDYVNGDSHHDHHW
jgi:hypothetical protein